MGLLADAYAWIDRNVAGGFLPGGETQLGVPGAGLVERVAGQFAPGTQLPSGFQAPAPTNGAAVPAAGIFGGGAAALAASGMPSIAPRAPAGPRGRTITATATVYPDGTIIPRRMVPGRSLVTSEDIKTVKRVKKVSRALARAFTKPAKKRRRRYSAPRQVTVTAKK